MKQKCDICGTDDGVINDSEARTGGTSYRCPKHTAKQLAIDMGKELVGGVFKIRIDPGHLPHKPHLDRPR